jgi:hypothetical protein
MKDKSSHAPQRRERARALCVLNRALDTFGASERLALAGDVTAATRAIRLAERQAKLAAQLIDLTASLRKIAAARLEAERALRADADAREAALKAREQKLHFAELALQNHERHAPPLDPEADRWKERLARLGERES